MNDLLGCYDRFFMLYIEGKLYICAVFEKKEHCYTLNSLILIFTFT